MNHKEGKWAKQILDARNEEGMWGNFHTLSHPTHNKAITTEQAIRRLRILGYTKDDEPIRTVIERMCLCVAGEKKIDNYYEKTHDWVLFEKLMLSAWIRLFDPQNEIVLDFANKWAFLAERAFKSGAYNRDDDIKAFTSQFGRKPKSSFETGFGMFYHAVLLQGILTPKTENLLIDYYLSKEDGIYYIYDKPLHTLPEVFAAKKTSYYLAAIEILLGYEQAGSKLQFIAEWLYANKDKNGQWDLGIQAKDGIYFPLSDSWRSAEDRKSDCTERITNIVRKIKF